MTIALGLSFQSIVAPDKEPSGLFRAFAGTPVTFTVAIPGQHFAIQSHLLNGGPESVNVLSLTVNASDGKDWKISGQSAEGVDLAAEKDLERRFTVIVPADAQLVKPYFERPDQEQPYYNLTDERFRNLSLAPYPLYATAQVRFRGVDWDLRQVVQTNSRLDGIGIKQEPLLTGPAISVSVSPSAGAVPLASTSFAFACSLHSNVKGAARGVLRLELPKGWHSVPADYPFAFARDGDGDTFSFRIQPGTVGPKKYEIRALAEYNGKSYGEGYRLVGYPGLRPYPYYRKAIYEATGVDVKTAPGIRVGFFPGRATMYRKLSRTWAFPVPILSPNDLQNGDLHQFDAIVTGVRAYSARPELRAANARLLNYVKQGGVLIVQYNLQNLDDGYGPYEFSLGSNPQKVVDEKSSIRFLEPASAALNWPNKITEADFSGWQEERGHGFMDKWDGHYQALLETHDPDQAPQRGGLLIARYGKGIYVYDALALYRQLPNGIPGAYRILANLVSLGKNPELK